MQIIVKDRTGHPVQCDLDKIPDTCPVCNNGIQPVSFEFYHSGQKGRFVEAIFRCPLESCDRLFVARYAPNPYGGFLLSYCFPVIPRDPSHSQEINDISQDFCSIYNQAHRAEALGLKLISGPGYRKALEFLIKDRLTALQTSAEAKADIAKLQLGQVINKYVTDTRMKTTAERAAWLGNDETHYVRKWEDKDLQDMKNLIKLTCRWIESELLTIQAVATMPPQGKKPSTS